MFSGTSLPFLLHVAISATVRRACSYTVPHLSLVARLPPSRKFKTTLRSAKNYDESFNSSVPITCHRRTLLTQVVFSTATSICLPSSSRASFSRDSSSSSNNNNLPPVTQKVFFDVRISRPDGTFYVKDDEEASDENAPFTGRIVFGLFGSIAPNHVSQFLTYVNLPEEKLMDDAPYPSYGRSTFSSRDPATGLLEGGFIPSLELTTVFGGTEALRYGERIVPAKLWLEKDVPLNPVSHIARGLLTHKNLDATPKFGITTFPCPELDNDYFVFGKLLLDEQDGLRFLQRIDEIKTYSALVTADQAVGGISVAAEVYNSQREFFRGAAKNLGDGRLSKVYDGKLLRRVEITRDGLL